MERLPRYTLGSVIGDKRVPRPRLAPPQLLGIDNIGIDAHGRLEKFGLRAEVERAGSAEAECRLAAHALGEGTLALGVSARVETPHRARRRVGADKLGVGLRQQADMDVVAHIA